jgi:hypothetical protein
VPRRAYGPITCATPNASRVPTEIRKNCNQKSMIATLRGNAHPTWGGCKDTFDISQSWHCAECSLDFCCKCKVPVSMHAPIGNLCVCLYIIYQCTDLTFVAGQVPAEGDGGAGSGGRTQGRLQVDTDFQEDVPESEYNRHLVNRASLRERERERERQQCANSIAARAW